MNKLHRTWQQQGKQLNPEGNYEILRDLSLDGTTYSQGLLPVGHAIRNNIYRLFVLIILGRIREVA